MNAPSREALAVSVGPGLCRDDECGVIKLPQGVVSEVLNGKRELNLRQVKALAARFSVPLEVFA